MTDAQLYLSGWVVIGAAATITCLVFQEWVIAAFGGITTVGCLLFLFWDIGRTRGTR